MRELVELRIAEEFAPLLFEEWEGKLLGSSVRKIEIYTDDPRYARVGELDVEIRKKYGTYFFAGWSIKYEYTKAEMEAADCYHVSFLGTFEPAGEECGTKYDFDGGCPGCGSDPPQLSALRLDLRRVPKNRDFARSIADELIVSQRAAEALIDAGLSGFELKPVRHRARYEDDAVDLSKIPSGRKMLKRAEAAGVLNSPSAFQVWLNREENREAFYNVQAEHAELLGTRDRARGKPLPVWYQFVVQPPYAEIVAPTHCGNGPFDDDTEGKYRCGRGDLLGLNVLSEVSIDRRTRGNADVVATRQFVGPRRGAYGHHSILRPTRLIIVSRKFREVVENAKLKRLRFDIAYLR